MAALIAPLSLSVTASKLHKLFSAGCAVGPRELLAVLGSDLAFLLALGAVCAAALYVARRAWWYVAAGVLQTLLLACLLISVADHAFFASQAELLPGEMLAYAIREAGMIRRVLASKMSLGIWLAMAVALLSPLLTLMLWRFARTARRSGAGFDATGTSRKARVWVWWSVAIAASLGFTRLEVAEDLDFLKRNAIVTLLQEAFREDPDLRGSGIAAEPGHRLELEAGPDTRRYNVVYVILESVRALSTTPYAPQLETTPFIAQLASRGARAEYAYAVVPHTSKALIPILCGFDPKISTAIHEARPGGIPGACLAELLAAQGYATAFIQPAEEEFERRRGLVANFGFETFLGKESLPPAGFEESSYFGYEDAAMLEPALEWVDQRERPFFLTVLTLTAHHAYSLPSHASKQDFAAEEPLNTYLNAVAYTDRFVESLFDAFEERGLLEETLFVIVGDHGEAFGEHGRWEHDNVLYEEGVRVPLLLFGAGVDEAGTVLAGLRATSDILPTVVEILGFRSSGGPSEGRSLFSSAGHDRLFFSCWYSRHCMAMRDGTRKTVYHYGRRGPEVFELAADPLETRNLLEGAGLERAQRAIERLKAWKRQNNARYRAHVGGRLRAPADGS